jgi:hypothetical protein
LEVKEKGSRSFFEKIREYVDHRQRLYTALLAGLVILAPYDLAVRLLKRGDRLVGDQVLIALLGATTVQLGTIAVIMARSVFEADVDALPGRAQ